MRDIMVHKNYREHADLIFLKVSERIFKVEKDRRGVFPVTYVSDKDVKYALNNLNVLILNDSHGLNTHRNFN